MAQRSPVQAGSPTLLAVLGDAPLHDFSQQHLARIPRKRPGHRVALRGFLSFIVACGGPNLVPGKTSRPSAIALERRLRVDIRAWRKRLESPSSTVEARTLVAMLIARIYALPIGRVLAMRRAEIAITPTSVILWPDADALILGEPLAGAYRRFTAADGEWAFPGRHGHQPLSAAAVRHHVVEFRS